MPQEAKKKDFTEDLRVQSKTPHAFDDFSLERQVYLDYERDYLEHRPKLSLRKDLPRTEARKLAFAEFRKNFLPNLKTVLGAYGFSHDQGYQHQKSTDFSDPDAFFQRIIIDMAPPQQNYVYKVSQQLVDISGGLKPQFTIHGKMAECVFEFMMNSILHFFHFPPLFRFSPYSRKVGGDGGYDFMYLNSLIDVKYRNESPTKGLFLDDKYLNNPINKDDNIIPLVTFGDSSKFLGFNEAWDLHSYPFAVTGWITLGDFRKLSRSQQARTEDGRIVYLADPGRGLRPVQDLIEYLLDKVINQSDFISYD